MSPNHPSPPQQRVLALLSTGSTAAAAAQSAGVHRNTVGNWLRTTNFQNALTEAQRDQDLAWRDQARSLAAQAPAATIPAPAAAAANSSVAACRPIDSKCQIVFVFRISHSAANTAQASPGANAARRDKCDTIRGFV